ncbi:MAG: hypothetical protein H6742_00370 [Alphaproteobacteria bacterium]|nr:hypothetical protein [Alphaproteobacteria bacterium]
MIAWLFVGAALAQDGAPAPVPPPAGPAAFVVGANGGGTVTLPDGAVLPLDRCTGVPAGALLCTDDTSYATLRLAPRPDQPGAEDIVLLPSTCVRVAVGSAAAAEVEVTRGGISVAPEPSRIGTLRVRTRDGLATGLAGGFRVQLEGDATRTEAVDGSVQLSNDVGAVDLDAGEGARVREGQAPEAPVDLLLTEALQSPDDGAALRRPDFRWQPVPYAGSYRIELAADPLFTDIVEATDVPAAEWLPELLFAPTAIDALYWRVSAYDRFGFLGVPSAPRRLDLPGGRPE